MIVREATQKDLLKIKDHGGAFIDRSISSNFVTYDGEGFLFILKAMIKQGLARLWACRADDGEFAGAICLFISPNVYNPNELLGDIYFIDVLPRFQKQGVAKKMMLAVEKWAKEIGIMSLSISFKSKAIADRVADSMNYTLFEYKLMKRIKE